MDESISQIANAGDITGAESGRRFFIAKEHISATTVLPVGAEVSWRTAEARDDVAFARSTGRQSPC
jgi:hypothetical protein